jgi:hypothetical protein
MQISKFRLFPIALLANLLVITLVVAQIPPPSIDDVFQELESGELTLNFFNALTGAPIPEANISIEGLGEGITDFEGKMLFPIPEDGIYNVTFTKEGFITATFKIEVMAGTLFFNRFSVSPVMPIGSLRVVLDWSDKPQDLDAHLIKDQQYHISYRNMRVTADGVAKLDRDDTDGYGPETITVNEIINSAHYCYFVHNYSDRSNHNSKSLSDSKGSVKIYGGDNKLLHVLTVPQDISGTYWNIFEITNGQVSINNRVQTNQP